MVPDLFDDCHLFSGRSLSLTAVYVIEVYLVVVLYCRILPYYGSGDGSSEVSGEGEESDFEDEMAAAGLLGYKYRKGVDDVRILPYREGHRAAAVSDWVCMIRLDLDVRHFHLYHVHPGRNLY